MTIETHFVTSTGTEIGKTLISTLLVNELSDHHDRIGYWKPVASGCRSTIYGYRSPDEETILKQTSLTDEDVISTFRFDEPLSPDQAAKRENRRIDPSDILDEWKQLRDRYEALVVEGIGGVAVPFSHSYDVTDMAYDLGLSALLVVSSQLGTISHTRTAYHYLLERDVSCTGIILTPAEGKSLEITNRNHLRDFYPKTFVDLLPRLDGENSKGHEVIKRYRSSKLNNNLK